MESENSNTQKIRAEHIRTTHTNPKDQIYDVPNNTIQYNTWVKFAAAAAADELLVSEIALRKFKTIEASAKAKNVRAKIINLFLAITQSWPQIVIVKSKFDHIKTEYCLENKQATRKKSSPENLSAILIFGVGKNPILLI